jgi:AraC-like DNA-binding protein
MEKKHKSGTHSRFIKDYIDKNYHQVINLDVLSEASFISKSCISHQFKKDLGMSPIDYLIRKRIEIARSALLNTSDTVTEVAKQVGYDNPLYFSALFKKQVGMSPTKYRKTCRQEDRF